MMNVLVEGLENVHHHSLPSHRDASFALLVRDDHGYRISFGNTVPLAMAALITHRVGIINEMDEADLKEHYLKLLSNSARSEHCVPTTDLDHPLEPVEERALVAQTRLDVDGLVAVDRVHQGRKVELREVGP